MTRPPEVKEARRTSTRSPERRTTPSRTRTSRAPPLCATARKNTRKDLDRVRAEWRAQLRGERPASPRRTSPRSSPSGPAFRSTAWNRRNPNACSTWRKSSNAASSARRRRSRRQQGAAPLPRRSQGPAPADRHVRLPGPHRRRQDLAGEDPRRVHVRLRRRAHPARHERVHGEVQRAAAWSGRRPATSATRKAANSPSRSAASPTRWCSSTRSRRPTRTC